jgi:3-carboxy-cis,cis-muconate cycloisomerase
LHAVAGALTGVVVAAGKVGTDVVLLSAGEVGEVSEGGGADHGGSSAMPHKRNPVTSVLLVAAARRAPAQLAAVVGAGVHEQERATGSWHAEWQPLRDLAHLAGGSAARATDVLGGLQVHPERMLANLLSAGPGLAAEPVATALAPALGRGGAQDAVRAALATVTATGRALADVLGDDPAVAAVLDAPARARLADPASSLGPVDSLVEALLSVGTEVAW